MESCTQQLRVVLSKWENLQQKRAISRIGCRDRRKKRLSESFNIEAEIESVNVGDWDDEHNSSTNNSCGSSNEDIVTTVES